MKKQTYFVFGILIGIILMITLLIQTVEAKDYKFIPADTTNIMITINELKTNPKLEIDIFGYVESFTKDNDNKLIEEVLKIRERYLKAEIDEIRITIGLGNKGGLIEEKYKFEKDGVYVKLGSK